MKVLAEHGASLNAISMSCTRVYGTCILNQTLDKDSNTALHEASRSGHSDVVKVLVERGADINAVGVWAHFQGTSLLNQTVDKDSNTAVHDASRRGHLEVVSVLIGGGADVNAIGMFLGGIPRSPPASNRPQTKTTELHYITRQSMATRT